MDTRGEFCLGSFLYSFHGVEEKFKAVACLASLPPQCYFAFNHATLLS